jgi:HrpA-like RNA helicase
MANLKELPIFKNASSVMGCITENDITFISTSTGSGKSLLTGYLASLCYPESKINHTVPRVMIANGLYEFISENFYNVMSVGVMTGRVNKDLDAPIIFCTEQSFFNRGKLQPSDILIIDEAHEQNVHTEIVYIKAVEHIKNGGKVIIMSATMDLIKYITFFKKYTDKVGVFELPDTDRQHINSIVEVADIDEALQYININGGRVLIGVPGKGDIENLTSKLLKIGYSDKIFPLHGELMPDEMSEYTSYEDDCVYIATSVAMSGVTINNLTHVVPAYTGKQMDELGNLLPYNLSFAEIKQWEGRVGRTCKGTVIRLSNELLKDREAMPQPEILRTALTETAVSFISMGIDMLNTEMLNKPEEAKILKAYKYLEANGIIDNNLTFTEKGNFIVKNGEGIMKGCLAYEGKKVGLEATARKVAVLNNIVSSGKLFGRYHHNFLRQLMQQDNSLAECEHLLFIKGIEEDTNLVASPTRSYNVIKEYCQENDIVLKNVNIAKRAFSYIDKNYKDTTTPTHELLWEVFKNQPSEFLVEGAYSDHIGQYVTSNNVSIRDGYVSLSSITLGRGKRLSSISTVKFVKQ